MNNIIRDLGNKISCEKLSDKPDYKKIRSWQQELDLQLEKNKV